MTDTARSFTPPVGREISNFPSFVKSQQQTRKQVLGMRYAEFSADQGVKTMTEMALYTVTSLTARHKGNRAARDALVGKAAQLDALDTAIVQDSRGFHLLCKGVQNKANKIREASGASGSSTDKAVEEALLKAVQERAPIVQVGVQWARSALAEVNKTIPPREGNEQKFDEPVEFTKALSTKALSAKDDAPMHEDAAGVDEEKEQANVDAMMMADLSLTESTEGPSRELASSVSEVSALTPEQRALKVNELQSRALIAASEALIARENVEAGLVRTADEDTAGGRTIAQTFLEGSSFLKQGLKAILGGRSSLPEPSSGSGPHQ